MKEPSIKQTRAHRSRNAIERLYIIMRHLFIRGSYKPMGVSGESLKESLLTLSPEIYGSMTDPEKVEIEGLLYILDRLPKGIEECRHIKMISREGLDNSDFEVIIPSKRRRNCFRIDQDQMYIELTRGRSDIYDILTHLTFLYIEAGKIMKNALDHRGRMIHDWKKLEEAVEKERQGKKFNREKATAYLSTLLGRTYQETEDACIKFELAKERNSLFHTAYWMGKLAMEESNQQLDREITFSATLRDRIGHHVYGTIWADNIKGMMLEKGLIERPVHIISSNLHSVMNAFYAKAALKTSHKNQSLEEIAKDLSIEANEKLREKVKKYALKNGMLEIKDSSGTNLTVQLIDIEKINQENIPTELKCNHKKVRKEKPIILVMDYAFGEQAFETMDELLKQHEAGPNKHRLPVRSISVMGKAGILEGDKGDIMVPTAHVFEGTTDNYPFHNELTKSDFMGHGLEVLEGPMITVLGTSLQNRDILDYFRKSSWNAIGLEMEGAHYQKAIQAAARIRSSIDADVKIRYAYYASDNPLKTGKTLASGSLGLDGVKSTYLITEQILKDILK